MEEIQIQNMSDYQIVCPITLIPLQEKVCF